MTRGDEVPRSMNRLVSLGRISARRCATGREVTSLAVVVPGRCIHRSDAVPESIRRSTTSVERLESRRRRHPSTSRSRSMILATWLLEVGVDLRERPGRDVLVEVPGERDLVADLGLLVVDPGVGDMREDLGLEVRLDRRGPAASPSVLPP